MDELQDFTDWFNDKEKGDLPATVALSCQWMIDEVERLRGNPAELKPCPFCGDDGIEIHDGLGGDEQLAVICFMCGSSGGYCDTEAEAIAAWNRRA